MASKDRSKSPNPPSPASSSPTLGKSSSSKKSNQKSVKLDVPTSFTIDVNQIASARKQLKNVGKAPTGDNDSGPLSSITVESPEKQGLLKIMASGAWDTKWCQLKEARLYIYPNQKAPIPESILSLNGSRVGDKKQHGVEYCFQITTQHGEILIFSADDDYEYITWIVALRGATLYLKISSFVVVESPATATATSPRDNNNSNNNHNNNNNNNKPSPLGSSSPSISPSVSPSVPRVETTSASPSLVKKGTVTSKSPNFALPPSSETKAFRNSTGDISKLPARLHAIDFNTPSTTPSTTPSSTLTPPSTSTSTPHTATGPSALLSPISAVGGADKFSSYRRSADVSKLSKDNYAPLSDAISAAYRKSVDVSKLSHSADVSKLSHSAHVLSPTATSSPHNLFSSVEIIPSEKELMEAKGGRRGLLGVPGGMFTKWKQRWVVLANDSLAVYKHEEDEDKKEPVHSFELIFCQPKVVKSEKGKYVFEIHAPGRTIQFGAPSSVDLLDWIHSIQETQTTLMQSYLQYNLGGNSKPGESEDGEDQLDLELEKSKKKLSNIMQSNGNNVCVDCGAADPIWASINWGVFICIECSGVHRQMGTHISKVRSVTMDKWDTEVLEFMENHGNAKVNSELEQNIPPNFTKITPTSSRHEREAYIKAKYEEKLFSKK